MQKIFQRFVGDEAGAITVDWVVLTGAIVATMVLVVPIISGALYASAGDIASVVEVAGD